MPGVGRCPPSRSWCGGWRSRTWNPDTPETWRPPRPAGACRRCGVGRRTAAPTRSPCARWEADTPRCRARGCRPQWPPNGRDWGGSSRSSTLAGRACSPTPPGCCSFPTSMLPLVLLLVAGDTSAYWQQQVGYEITASLDEPSGVLTGHVRISYVNRSPDTLRDFYVHQYLNAFHPGSRWAAADSAEQRERFQHLKDPDYAFERITGATVMGQPLRPDYPYAPDSTIAHWTLPRSLVPGDSLTVEIDWLARLSTLPRRQGRQGRRFDFAQWYPKVVVYDRYGWEDHPLYPGGEFYGEFATFDVMLDLPQDQVIGATGVPVEGDPGWDHAKADQNLRIDYQRQWYRSPLPAPGCAVMRVGPGRKCVRFRAEDVHHFAFSLNPDYIYEQGRYGEAVVRVLYQPGDRATWGQGKAVQNTVLALAWLDSLFGKYQWPQLTNVHRIEGGGTEFPMMMMDGSASIGLIVHETGHQYVMGQLANNEWREGWLDEGFSDFQEGWFFEAHGGPPAYDGLEPGVLWLDLERWSEPISTVSEQFRDFLIYQEMIYSKAQLFYEQLRYVVGDETMRRILREYFARWKLKHVDEDAFRRVAEEVSREDLKWLFGEWLHATPLIDYRLRRVERHRLAGGRWRTVVTVERKGDGRMPVEIGDRDTIYARATGEPVTERVEFTSARKPGRLMLDPRGRTHDYDMLNNRERRAFVGRGAVGWRLDDPTRETAKRDKLVSAWLPVAWSNDFGGVTLAVRNRTNYLDRYNRGLSIASAATGNGASQRFGFYGRWSNPIRQDVEGFGRFTGEASVRAPFPLGTTLGVRLFGGAYAGRSAPVPQRRIPIAGADPYETFTNPLLRSAGALFVRPDFYYHAPGNGNLRGFRNDLGGRWAVTVNLELARSVWRRDRGILRDVSLNGFVDGGLADTLAVSSTSPGRRYTPLYDGGVGLVTRHQIRDLGWTMRVELPLVVSRSSYAADPRPSEGRLAFRWQLSLSPSF